MFRRSNRWHSRFDQPDPYDGSYDFTDPQSFNRYAYVQGDPVNFVDPSGLAIAWVCGTLWDGRENLGTACGFLHFPSPFPNLPSDLSGGRDREDPDPEKPTPTPEDDPCDTGKHANEVQRDLKQIATTIGGKLDSSWNIHGPRRSTVETAIGKLTDAGFAEFNSYNSAHPGANLQGQINGRWYHVTITPVSTPNAAVNSGGGQRKSGQNSATNSHGDHPPSRIKKVEAHCDKNKPDSIDHLIDYFKSFF